MKSRDEATLLEWNRTDVEFQSDKCIHDLLEAQALRTPEKTAVVCRDRSLTYAALHQRAHCLADRLCEAGVGPETIVAILMDRSLDTLVALLGVLKAGGAYLPLDPAFPAERIAFMLKDSEAGVILTQSNLKHRVVDASAMIICLDEFDFGDEASEPAETVASGQSTSSLAYLMYTSGSTGTPKGVMVEHRNVVNFFAAMDRVAGTEPGVWLAVTSISFDISVLELLWTLSRGFTVVLQIVEDGLDASGDYSVAAQMRRHRVTHFQCTPTLAKALA
ncbi:MAG: AMP-binding protein, partial [Candidatus Binatus sp.]